MLSTTTATTSSTNNKYRSINDGRLFLLPVVQFVYEEVCHYLSRFYSIYIQSIVVFLTAAATTTTTTTTKLDHASTIKQTQQQEEQCNCTSTNDEIIRPQQYCCRQQIPAKETDTINNSSSKSLHEHHDTDLTITEWEEDDVTSFDDDDDNHVDNDVVESVLLQEELQMELLTVLEPSDDLSSTVPIPGTKKRQIVDFKRHQILGEGQFGQVWLVSDRETRTSDGKVTTYALKVLSKYDLICNDEVDLIVREKDIMVSISQVPHPCIVQLYASFHDEHFVYLLQEFCQGGELLSLMHNSNKNILRDDTNHINERNVAFYIACIVNAMEYLHLRHHIVYRDLKPENVMIDANTGYPKIIDFGYAKQLSTDTVDGNNNNNNNNSYKTYTFCGTPNYVAPEMIIGDTDGCSFPVDYWALGIVLHEMLFPNSHPFIPLDITTNMAMNIDQQQLFDSICNDEYVPPPQPIDNSSVVSTVAIDLIQKLLIKDPIDRLGRTPLNTNTTDNESCSQSVGNHLFFKLYDINMDAIYHQQIIAPYIPNIQNVYDTSSFEDDTKCLNDCINDRFIQKYPKLTKREATMFDGF